MTAPHDRSPRGPAFDYIRPEQRVPREPSCAPSLKVELSVAIFIILTLIALPDLLDWFSTWPIFQ